MTLTDKLGNKIFDDKFIIGMIHMAGVDSDVRVRRAVEEAEIYQNAGIDGVIVENYDYGATITDVENAVNAIQKRELEIKVGVNLLGRMPEAFAMAATYKLPFIQIDTIEPHLIDMPLHKTQRDLRPSIAVLGGVGFKYTNSRFEDDPEGTLRGAMEISEGIVTTGDGTGIDTPIEKLIRYRDIMDGINPESTLVVGAGVDRDNAYEQFKIVNGAIIGSAFKPRKNTEMPVEPALVREIVYERNKFRP